MKVVGKGYANIDGRGILAGKPAYTNDLAAKNALIVKVLRSPYAFAKIKSIDASKALALDGVECVLTHEDVGRIPVTRAGQGYPEPSPHDKFILDSVVRHVGDEVCAVAAKDIKTCEDALKLIKVEYEELEPVLDFEKAYENKSIIHDEEECHDMFPIGFEPKKNVAAAYDLRIGDVDKVMSECDVVVNESFYTQAQAHAMMEPHTAFVDLDYRGRLNIISSTQTPTHVRRIVSTALDYPISKIRVVKPRVGGGFGGKQCVHAELILCAIVLKTGKPCKMVYTRKEVFESSYSRHPMRFDVKIGATKEGKIKALDVYLLSDTGAYGEHALTVFMVAGSKTLPLYNKAEAVRFTGRVVYTNHTPGGAYRGYGAIQGNYAIESAMDMLATKLGMDPIELREKNMIGLGETSEIFAKMGEGTEGTAMTITSCKLDECVSRGKELIGWKKETSKDKNKAIGYGMAIAMQGSGIPYIDMASAVIKLNDGGFYNLIIGATDIGQGSDTILAQMAAEVLETSLDKIIVYSSDTDLTPFDTGAYASSTTYISGNAVIKAAKNMKAMIIKEGAHALGVKEEEVQFDGKTVKASNGKEISLVDLSNRLIYGEDQKQLVANDSYVGHKSPPPFMAGFAKVEVDKLTGFVKVLDYVAVVDCGTTINPKLCKTQVDGGILQGIGMALYEEATHSTKGKPLNSTFMSYRIPTRKEVNKITVEFVDTYEETGPFGAKSVGEIGIDTPPAVISNAIYDAVGVRIKSLPARAEDVLLGMDEKE